MVFSSSEERNALSLAKDLYCVIEYPNDIVPENDRLLGVGVELGVNVMDLIRAGRRNGLEASALVDVTDSLNLFLGVVSLSHFCSGGGDEWVCIKE